MAELETDPFDVPEFNSLRNGEVVLDEALQGALRLVLTEEGFEVWYLASDAVAERLSRLPDWRAESGAGSGARSLIELTIRRFRFCLMIG